MKIVVFSDSHGMCDYMISEASKLKKSITIDYIIHLGDLVRDAEFLQKNFPEIPVLYVYGNCDFTLDIKEQEKKLKLGEKKFFILHGHTQRVKFSLASLENIAVQKDYDVILYGHTHTPDKKYVKNKNGAGTYIINPGSITDNRDGSKRSYCVIDIAGDDMGINIVYV
jgi:putative phosphoesterase